MTRLLTRLSPSNRLFFTITFNRFMRLYKISWTEGLRFMTLFMMIITTFYIAFGQEIGDFKVQVNFGILLISWLFVLILSNNRSMEYDLNQGFLQQFYIYPCWFECVILARYLADLVYTMAVMIVIFPIALLMLQIQYEYYMQLFITLALFTIFVNLIISMANSIILCTKSYVIASIIIMPLIIPGMIFAIISLEQVVYVWALVSMTCILFPIIIIANTMILKIAIEEGS